MSPASNPVIISPRIVSHATSTWANGRGGQLVAGMDVPVASEEASGAAGAEVVVAEEVPEESRPPEVQEEPCPQKKSWKESRMTGRK